MKRSKKYKRKPRETKSDFWEKIKSEIFPFGLSELVSSELIKFQKYSLARMFYDNQFLLFGALEAASRPQQDQEFVPPFHTLLLAPSRQFHASFRMRRAASIAILNNIKSIEPRASYRDLLALAYYLGSAEHTLQDCAKVFGLESAVAFATALESVSDQLLRISYMVNLLFPDGHEQNTIAEMIEKKYGFPDVIGILGLIKLKCEDRNNSRIYIQTVCDDKYMFRDLFVTTTCSEEMEIMKSSSLYRKVSLPHPKGRYLLANSAYDLMEQVLPAYIESAPLTPQAVEFNIVHSKVMIVFRESLRKLFYRFPKLLVLDIPSVRIAMAACILHNKCQLIDPLVFSSNGQLS